MRPWLSCNFLWTYLYVKRHATVCLTHRLYLKDGCKHCDYTHWLLDYNFKPRYADSFSLFEPEITTAQQTALFSCKIH